jgi:heat shock protein HslJ
MADHLEEGMVKLLQNFRNKWGWLAGGAAVLALLLGFLFFAPMPAALQSHEWTLESVQTVDGTVLWTPISSQFTMKFDAYEVNGTGSCNSFGGPVRATRVFNTLSFGLIFHTLMACLPSVDNDHESAFFAALDSATKYEVKAEKLYVYFDGSTRVLVFK